VNIQSFSNSRLKRLLNLAPEGSTWQRTIQAELRRRGKPQSLIAHEQLPLATIWLCQPVRSHKRTQCVLCANAFGEPFVRFFCERNPNFPVCRKCAIKRGFAIPRIGGPSMRGRRGEGGVIEITEIQDEENGQ
jgi:hypothetical protein